MSDAQDPHTYERLIHNREFLLEGMPVWRWVATDGADPRSDGGAWHGPINDWLGSHKNLYFQCVKKFDVVVQAGGACGMYPRIFSNYFKTVYTFEPDPLNFFTLVVNCQKDNIIKMQAALGDKHTMIQVARLTNQNVGMNRVVENDVGIVPQLMIDDLKLTACDFIQLDVELYEIYALRGAVETIKKFRPVIAVENRNDDIDTLLINELGYKIYAQSQMDTIYHYEEKNED